MQRLLLIVTRQGKVLSFFSLYKAFYNNKIQIQY